MKVNPNDFTTKSSRDIKRIKINKKSQLPSPINPRITSPILKANKTIQKYINEKLSSIKKNNISKKEENSLQRNKPKINFKNHPNLIKNKLIISPKQRYSQKSIEVIKKQKNTKESNKKNKSKNKVNIINNYKSIEHSNKPINIILNKNQNSKESKLINSISTSSGLSFCSNENKKNLPFNNNGINNSSQINTNKNNNCNCRTKNSQSNTKINSNTKNIEGDIKEDTNKSKHNINNFNYESGSEDKFSENKIYLKCDNYSLLTFGNSFSYSNSKRSKSTKKKVDKNNEEYNIDQNKTINICKDLVFNYGNNNKNNNYVNELKKENETLKKELKESSDQISFLIYQIKELKQNKNNSIKKYHRNKKICSPNIWKNKNIKLSLIENKINKKNINNNFDKNTIVNNQNDKIKFNKDLLKDINKEIINRNSYNNCRKKIQIKRKLNLNKIKRKSISISYLENSHHHQNISDNLSNLKI